MKNIDLAQAVSSAFARPISEPLPEKFGLPPELIERVTARAAPLLIAALSARSTMPGGAVALFSAIMSSDANARIAEQLDGLCMMTAGLKDLESSGDALMMRATGCRIAAQGDRIATEIRVPSQAVHGLTGMTAAVLFGVLKHHVLLEQGDESQLTALLGQQWATLQGHPVPTLVQSVPQGASASVSPGPSAAGSSGPAARSGQPAAQTQAPDQPSPAALAVRSLAAEVSVTPQGSAARPSQARRRGVWILFAVLATVLGALFAYGSRHPGVTAVSGHDQAGLLPEVGSGPAAPPAGPATATATATVPEPDAATAAVPEVAPASPLAPAIDAQASGAGTQPSTGTAARP
ncbi:hypothetical protein R75461_07885 [Paraburkholderia nemoris]|uniref:DUF937 domain-containing protein n=1 Tax=Paraburkholderia nemoris TaxID=2793076 RepID=UPI00190B6BB0|nr:MULTISPECIES: DUF937 domain-containing protein [Paraburkholderia]MBK3786917.1 hypothetical protein [Paraburkholderia aspalathi]CAE6859042.1 hypothetical protein R75461_07885 [Paraburkholderia nemoris]